MWSIFRRKGRAPVSIETQLETLAACGIRLAPGRTVDALIGGFDRAAFEADPYRLILAAMGDEAEIERAGAPPPGFLSDDIWHFDTECIENHGDYVRIASRLRTLAKGSLPLESLEDHVDVERGAAWVAFHLDGQQHRWDAAVDDDWVDSSILERFADLLTRRRAGVRFTYMDLGGQDCLIGCATEEQRAALNAKTGLAIHWLK